MVFLVQDQNQGTRTTTIATRKAREAAATVLFHPDSDRRLRSCTESADPSFPVFPETEGARGLGLLTLTAGGDFHPALRTSTARNGQPAGNYGQSLPGRQGALAWGTGATNPGRPEIGKFAASKKLTTGLRAQSDSDLFSNS